MAGRVQNLLTLGSQFLNVLIFGGEPDETISGRCYRQGVLHGHPRWAKAREIVDFVFFVEPGHCYRSHMRDVAYATMILKSEKEYTTNG